MKVNSECAFVARKVLTTKVGNECPIANFSDGQDVIDCIDQNQVTKLLDAGAKVKAIFDLSTNKVLRLLSVEVI